MENKPPLGKKLHTQALLVKRINRAVRMLERNYNDPPSVQQLSQQVGISVSHFHSVFKAVVGESMAQYCLRLRIERSAALLKYSAWDVGEIGGLCGFQTHASFSRRFKQFYQVTPRQYRAQQTVSPFLQGNLRQTIQENEARLKESNVRVAVSEWAELNLICLRFYGPVHGIFKPWKTMLQWLRSLDVDHTQVRFFGLWFDGWESLDNNQFRYECAIQLPDGNEFELPHWAFRRTMLKGLVACAATSGSIRSIERDWLSFSTDWFPYSNYQPRGEFVMDEYPHELTQGSLFINAVKLLSVGVPIKMCIPIQTTPTLY